ncbi:hypothetical protein V6Z11_A01G174100 [Gossypium hirsutum]
MRLSSLDESSIQSKNASDSTSLFQIVAKRIRNSRGFRRASSTKSQRLGQRPGLEARRRTLTSSSLASSGGSVRTPTFPVCNFCGQRHPDGCYQRTRVCFQCGSIEHFVRDRPRASDALPTQT